MDRFTRNYLSGLGLAALLAAGWWLTTLDFRAAELNRILSDDPLVAGYVYQFRVRSVQNGVAEVFSPRSAEASAMRFLGLVRPELRRLDAEDSEMIAAEQELARVQAHTRALLLDQPDVDRVRWVLDRAFYESRGVVLN